MAARDSRSQSVEEFIDEKQLTLVVADLFERIAQKERQEAEAMLAPRACARFQVDVRSAAYFRCKCGHLKSAHVFAPVQDAHFISSANLQSKWKVSSDDNSPSKSSLLSTSELSFGGDPADDEAWAMRPLPCLDEFKKNFPIGREMLLQPRAELEAALESSFGNFDNDTLSGGGGGGSLLQSPCKSEDNDTQEENNTDMGTESGGWDGDAEWGLDAHRRVKRQVEKRVRAELSVAFKKEVAKKQRECLAAAEAQQNQALVRLELMQRDAVAKVEENCRDHISELQAEFLGQLEQIEANAQAHVAQVRKAHDEAEARREARRRKAVAGLQQQINLQREELRALRSLRDTSSSGGISGSNSGIGSGFGSVGGGFAGSGSLGSLGGGSSTGATMPPSFRSPLRGSSLSLTPQLSQLEEEDEASLHEELDEDDDNSQADSLDGSAISSLGSSTGRGGGNGSSGNIDSAANNADAPVNVASRDAAVVNPTSKDATISTNLALSAKRVSNISNSSTNDLPSSTPAESHKSHTSSSSSPSRGLGRTLLWSSLLGAVILALAAQLVVVLAPLALSECSDLFAPLSDVAASTAAAEGDAGTREVANSRSSGMSGIAMTCSARVIRSLLTADRS